MLQEEPNGLALEQAEHRKAICAKLLGFLFAEP